MGWDCSCGKSHGDTKVFCPCGRSKWAAVHGVTGGQAEIVPKKRSGSPKRRKPSPIKKKAPLFSQTLNLSASEPEPVQSSSNGALLAMRQTKKITAVKVASPEPKGISLGQAVVVVDQQPLLDEPGPSNSGSTITVGPNTKLRWRLSKTLGGDNGAALYEAPHDRWMVWKPASGVVGAAERGASRLAHLITGGLVPIAVPMAKPGEQEEGLAQTFVEMVGLKRIGNIVNRRVDLSRLSQEQLAELFVHAIADWVCSNWDTHDGNFGIATSGQIVAIDKGQAFKFFSQGLIKSTRSGFVEPRTLDLTKHVLPRRPNVPVYPALAAELEARSLASTPLTANHDHITLALDLCDRMEPRQLEDCLDGYADLAFPQQQRAFLHAVHERVQGVRSACIPYVGEATSKLQSPVIGPLLSPLQSKLPPNEPPSGKPKSSAPVAVPVLVVANPQAQAPDPHPLMARPSDHEAFEKKLGMLGGIETFVEEVAEAVRANGDDHDLQAPGSFGDLTDSEKIAIFKYTRQWFKFWNPALRTAAGDTKHRELRRHESGIRVCTSGLSKLDVYDGAVYRVESSYKKRHGVATPGAEIDWWAFSSTGYNIDFLRQSEFAGGVEWHIEGGHRGRRVDFMSGSPQEGEVLFLPGTKMKVVARSGDPTNGQIVIIRLREV